MDDVAITDTQVISAPKGDAAFLQDVQRFLPKATVIATRLGYEITVCLPAGYHSIAPKLEGICNHHNLVVERVRDIEEDTVISAERLQCPKYINSLYDVAVYLRLRLNYHKELVRIAGVADGIYAELREVSAFQVAEMIGSRFKVETIVSFPEFTAEGDQSYVDLLHITPAQTKKDPTDGCTIC